MNELDEENLKFWKAGIIYNNPNDPDIWVRKKTGLGWTLNFAHSQSYYIVGLFLVFTLTIVVFAMLNDQTV